MYVTLIFGILFVVYIHRKGRNVLLLVTCFREKRLQLIIQSKREKISPAVKDAKFQEKYGWAVINVPKMNGCTEIKVRNIEGVKLMMREYQLHGRFDWSFN